LRYTPTAEEDKAANIAVKEILKVSSGNIQVYSWGSGKPVLFTHGWAGRGTQFRKFVEPFNKKGYKVIAFDGPSHGKSDGSTTNIHEFYQAIRAIQTKYGEFEALIGHSFGGVASMYSLLKGVSSKKLVLIASPSLEDDIIANFLKIVNGSPKRGEYFREYYKSKFGINFSEITMSVMSEKIKSLPILLVHDEDDKDVPIFHAEALQSKLKYPEMLRTSGLGHMRILKDHNAIKRCLSFVSDNELPPDNVEEFVESKTTGTN
jgi:pimeloyl-ACP methyl ester carboxylesterase